MSGAADFDARLAALRARFLDRCREDLETLRAPPDATTLRAVLHRLAGSAGTFGHAEVSELAGRAEDQLLAGGAPDLAGLIEALSLLPGRPPGAGPAGGG